MTRKAVAQKALESLRTFDEAALPSTARPPATYMGRVGEELKTNLQGRIEYLEEKLASTAVVLSLDPKRVRATKFINRHELAFLETDKRFIQLRESLRLHGQETPVRVRAAAGDPAFDYEIVSGHRRHRACLALDAEVEGGFMLLALLDEKAAEAQNLALTMYRENADREDLSPFETGHMFRTWLAAGIFTGQAQIAQETHLSVPTISQYLALADLPTEVIEAFKDPRNIAMRWVQDLNRALKDHRDAVLEVARELRDRPDTLMPEQIKALLTAPRVRTGDAPSRERYEQTIRLADRKTVGAKVMRDGHSVAVRLGRTVANAELLRKLTERVEAAVHELLREEEGDRA